MQFFDGFFLSQTSANSLLNTSQTPLWVAPLKQENKFEEIVDFLQIQDDQDKVAFIEKDQSFHFQKYYGLKYFLKFQSDSSPVCIFDNHNHALFFWADFLQ
ncbi:hypothetical protein IJM86_03915 [bacterium]|nr:hypothetical protein [bacterium]